MKANTAGPCIRADCPSDSLFWEPIKEGNLFTCLVCDTQWFEPHRAEK